MNHDHDPKWRAEFDDYSDADIPTDLQWDNVGETILTEVERRKKRRRLLLWWWWTGGLSLGIILFIGWWINQPDLAALPIPMTKVAKSEPVEQSDFSIKTKSLQSIDNQAIKNKSSFNTDSIISIKQPIENTTRTKESIVPRAPKDNTANADSEINLASPLDFYIDKNVANLTQETIDSKRTQLPTATQNDTIETRSSFTILDNIATKELRLIEKENIPDLPKTISIENANPNPWSLVISGGGNAFQPQTILNLTDGDTPLTSWQTEVSLQKNVRNKLILNIGIGYEQLLYRFNFQSEQDVMLYRPNTVDTIFTNPFAGTETVVTTDSVAGIRRQFVQQHNQHRTLRLPLLVGWRLGKGRFFTTLQTGIVPTYRLGSSGLVTNDGKEIIDISELYQTGFGLRIPLKLGLEYRLSPQISLLTNINVEKPVDNWLKSELNEQLRPWIYHANIGLQFYF
ncbi:MAG: hypothetical protein AB8G22_27060 [Saprospiraceae bacterium]